MSDESPAIQRLRETLLQSTGIRSLDLLALARLDLESENERPQQPAQGDGGNYGAKAVQYDQSRLGSNLEQGAHNSALAADGSLDVASQRSSFQIDAAQPGVALSGPITPPVFSFAEAVRAVDALPALWNVGVQSSVPGTQRTIDTLPDQYVPTGRPIVESIKASSVPTSQRLETHTSEVSHKTNHASDSQGATQSSSLTHGLTSQAVQQTEALSPQPEPFIRFDTSDSFLSYQSRYEKSGELAQERYVEDVKTEFGAKLSSQSFLVLPSNLVTSPGSEINEANLLDGGRGAPVSNIVTPAATSSSTGLFSVRTSLPDLDIGASSVAPPTVTAPPLDQPLRVLELASTVSSSTNDNRVERLETDIRATDNPSPLPLVEPVLPTTPSNEISAVDTASSLVGIVQPVLVKAGVLQPFATLEHVKLVAELVSPVEIVLPPVLEPPPAVVPVAEVLLPVNVEVVLLPKMFPPAEGGLSSEPRIHPEAVPAVEPMPSADVEAVLPAGVLLAEGMPLAEPIPSSGGAPVVSAVVPGHVAVAPAVKAGLPGEAANLLIVEAVAIVDRMLPALVEAAPASNPSLIIEAVPPNGVALSPEIVAIAGAVLPKLMAAGPEFAEVPPGQQASFSAIVPAVETFVPTHALPVVRAGSTSELTLPQEIVLAVGGVLPNEPTLPLGIAPSVGAGLSGGAAFPGVVEIVEVAAIVDQEATPANGPSPVIEAVLPVAPEVGPVVETLPAIESVPLRELTPPSEIVPVVNAMAPIGVAGMPAVETVPQDTLTLPPEIVAVIEAVLPSEVLPIVEAKLPDEVMSTPEIAPTIGTTPPINVVPAVQAALPGEAISSPEIVAIQEAVLPNAVEAGPEFAEVPLGQQASSPEMPPVDAEALPPGHAEVILAAETELLDEAAASEAVAVFEAVAPVDLGAAPAGDLSPAVQGLPPGEATSPPAAAAMVEPMLAAPVEEAAAGNWLQVIPAVLQIELGAEPAVETLPAVEDVLPRELDLPSEIVPVAGVRAPLSIEGGPAVKAVPPSALTLPLETAVNDEAVLPVDVERVPAVTALPTIALVLSDGPSLAQDIASAVQVVPSVEDVTARDIATPTDKVATVAESFVMPVGFSTDDPFHNAVDLSIDPVLPTEIGPPTQATLTVETVVPVVSAIEAAILPTPLAEILLPVGATAPTDATSSSEADAFRGTVEGVALTPAALPTVSILQATDGPPASQVVAALTPMLPQRDAFEVEVSGPNATVDGHMPPALPADAATVPLVLSADATSSSIQPSVASEVTAQHVAVEPMSSSSDGTAHEESGTSDIPAPTPTITETHLSGTPQGGVLATPLNPSDWHTQERAGVRDFLKQFDLLDQDPASLPTQPEGLDVRRFQGGLDLDFEYTAQNAIEYGVSGLGVPATLTTLLMLGPLATTDHIFLLEAAIQPDLATLPWDSSNDITHWPVESTLQSFHDQAPGIASHGFFKTPFPSASATPTMFEGLPTTPDFTGEL